MLPQRWLGLQAVRGELCRMCVLVTVANFAPHICCSLHDVMSIQM